ncbi:hypothetical protein [Nonomuraea salmonea]|uniref:hypothetical protein n=1 Tax=Nonomuraea salmonea TaxID=46181 RepID=UPI0031EA87D2
MSTPADVANTVLFLASEANGNVSGQVIHVAGGAIEPPGRSGHGAGEKMTTAPPAFPQARVCPHLPPPAYAELRGGTGAAPGDDPRRAARVAGDPLRPGPYAAQGPEAVVRPQASRLPRHLGAGPAADRAQAPGADRDGPAGARRAAADVPAGLHAEEGARAARRHRAHRARVTRRHAGARPAGRPLPGVRPARALPGDLPAARRPLGGPRLLPGRHPPAGAHVRHRRGPPGGRRAARLLRAPGHRVQEDPRRRRAHRAAGRHRQDRR